MSQESLFDAALKPQHPARRTVNVYAAALGSSPIKAQLDSPESVDAAIANMPSRSGQRERVLAFLTEYPSTDEQVQDALAMDPNTERPRRVELAQAGLIKKVGVARTRSGRQAAVWGRA